MQNEISLNTIGNNLVDDSTRTATNLYSKFYSTRDSNSEDDSDSNDDCIKGSFVQEVNRYATVEKYQSNPDVECDYGYGDTIESNRIDGECHHHVRRNSCLINKEKNVLTTIVERTSILGLGHDCLTPELDGPPRMSDRDLKHNQMRKAEIVIAMYNQ
jgi:hypothetical protein